MTDYCVHPTQSPITGTIKVPGDKSISHRALLLGAIADGETRISGILLGEDVLCTMQAIRNCGVEVIANGNDILLRGKGKYGLQRPKEVIDCGNSGTAMRLLTGLLAAQNFPTTLVGDASLSRRPMNRVVKPLSEMGAAISVSDRNTPPINISPVTKLKAIEWQMQVASAQVKSAILLAGLCADGETSVVEPTPTRDHTERMLEAFGCPPKTSEHTISINGEAQLQGTTIRVPGDISSAAFFIAAALLHPTSNLDLVDVGINSTRTGFLEVLKLMGAEIQTLNPKRFGGERVGVLRVRDSKDKLKGIAVPEELVPSMIDEIPVLAVVAACAEGTTTISGCAELRVKESDRIRSVCLGLQNLGIKVIEQPDGMIVEGGDVTGGTVDSFGDHRIAMAFAILGSLADSPVTIRNSDCVATSFPEFLEIASQCQLDITAVDTADGK